MNASVPAHFFANTKRPQLFIVVNTNIYFSLETRRNGIPHVFFKKSKSFFGKFIHKMISVNSSQKKKNLSPNWLQVLFVGPLCRLEQESDNDAAASY